MLEYRSNGRKAIRHERKLVGDASSEDVSGVSTPSQGASNAS